MYFALAGCVLLAAGLARAGDGVPERGPAAVAPAGGPSGGMVPDRAVPSSAVPTVAVLPLEEGAGSAAYAGLGKALAGMVVSDLSVLPGLQLVEREQLDAMMAELKLRDTGFLDPATAQRLGRGVGAQFLVAGTWSVVGTTFVLDARVVQVETGAIVKAAKASGLVADFVSVEKELVEGLVEGLEVTLSGAERRKLLTQAPTEKFTAFSAYSEGVAKKEAGDMEAAESAFARALAEDPEYAAARAELSALGALVAAQKTARQDQLSAVVNEAHAKLLAEVPDERTRPADFTHDVESLARFALRLGVLEAEGRDCDRYAEMRHYAKRAGWVVKEPPGRKSDGGVLTFVLYQESKARGLDGSERAPGTPEYLKESLPARTSKLFRDLPSFLFNEQTVHRRAHGMLSSLLACHQGAAALKELDAVAREVTAAGLADSPMEARRTPTVSVGEQLTLWWARTRAQRLGADAELRKRTEALLAGARDSDERQRLILTLVDEVLTLARQWEDHRARRRGLTEEEVVRRVRMVATGDLGADVMCKQVVTSQRSNAVSWAAEYDRLVKDRSNFVPTHVDMGLMHWSAAADFGCLAGVPARFARPADAWAYMDNAHERELPNPPSAGACASSWVSLDQFLETSRPWRSDPTAGPMYLFNAQLMSSSLVYHRCVRD